MPSGPESGRSPITGDHRDTAAAIAMELGIITSPDQAVTGAELDEMSEAQFSDKIENFSVYARVQPEHKVRIVQGWQEKGMVTAMTGTESTTLLPLKMPISVSVWVSQVRM